MTLLGFGYISDGGTGPIDPEGAAYLMFFTLSSMPGLVLGLFATMLSWRFLRSRSTLLGLVMSLAITALISMLSYVLLFHLMGIWSSFDPRMLFFPALVGSFGAAIVFGLGWKQAAVRLA
jgi:hypothetical protein